MEGWLVQTYCGNPQQLASVHFGNTELRDPRRGRRLLKIARNMFVRPGGSIPQACGAWSQTIGAYRFFSNPKVSPAAMLQTHFELLREHCGRQPLVLCVQDHTELSFSSRHGMRGIGKISGEGRGLLQHSALAVSPQGQIWGLLDLRWATRVPSKAGESLRERQSRWSESELWSESAQAIGRLPQSCRLLQVADRGADVFSFMARSAALGHGFLIRAQFDRYVETPEPLRLWTAALQQTPGFQMEVQVSANEGTHFRHSRKQRKAWVQVRYRAITIPPPSNDPRTATHPGLGAWLLLVDEATPPAGTKPVQWLLLCSEAVENESQARQVIDWYGHRWVIEEWHRVLKEALHLEESLMDDGADIQRLSAILSVQAVQLMVLRDLARHPREVEQGAKTQLLPWSYLRAGALMAGVEPEHLSYGLLWDTIARRGGWLARKNDGPPGWKVLWRGWKELLLMARTIELMNVRTFV